MAGRRLREAVKETLISSGNGEFDDQIHVVIAGLTNAYSQYVATFEEYKQQRYEAASTLYGPHTLSAYIQEFKKLAESMAKGDNITTKGPLPPDLFSVQLSLLPDPTGDSPPRGINFGDIKQDITVPKSGTFRKGDRAIAIFWSANPRYDLLTEGTFAVVEMLQGEKWLPEYDDDDFCLFFKWQAENVSDIARGTVTSYGHATLEWEVPEEASPGVYRLRHFGSTKETKESSNYYYTELISMPIILVAPHSLAPSATYRSFSESIRGYTIINIYNQGGVGGEITANPIDPKPKITTVEPGSTSAVFQAAPTPETNSINMMSWSG